MPKSIPAPVLLTVLMPVYNGAAYLREAIESILGQTFGEFELLILDDASKDDSAAVIRSFKDPRIRFVSNEENLGLIGTLNKGLELAHGDIIARMDQDDIAVPERLAKQYEFLAEHPDILAIGTATTLLSAAGKPVGSLPVLVRPEAIKRALAVLNPFTHPSMMFRRTAALQVGGYSEEAYAAEDYDLWSRLSEVGKLSNLDEPLLLYRLNPGGMSISLRTAQKKQTERVATRQWKLFGPQGPAPKSDWHALWPSAEKAGMSPAHLLLYSTLHLLFAKAYRQLGNRQLAWSHLRASLQWYRLNRGSYLALLMFVLPFAVYARLEERIAVLVNDSRAGKAD